VFLLDIFFPHPSVRYQKQKAKLIAEINKKEKEVHKLPQEEFPKRINEFKKEVNQGVSLDKILPEVFSLIREASLRTLKQRSTCCDC